jgi:hypothetical protein
MHLKMKITALTVAGSAAALVLAATPALASSHGVSKPGSGQESAYGVVYGRQATIPVIPMKWRGLVETHGIFSPRGNPPEKGQSVTFTTSAGDFVAEVTARPVSHQTFDRRTCYVTDTTDVDFRADGRESSGEFSGLSGRGTASAYFAGYTPRLMHGPKKGECNTDPNAPEITKGAVASVSLNAVLTTP